ncbi:MAG TPA: polysaccharide biosynthesis/export family protein [Gemmatimonadaceae bacterium]
MTSLFKLGLAATIFLAPLPRAAGAQTAPASLPLRPGDRAVIRIWADSSLMDTLRVDDNGSIMLPRIGPMSIAGVPAPAIGDSIRKAYAALLRPVSIEVTPLRRVSVVGEVHKPGVLYLETNTTVRDAVAQAGGVDDIGRENPIILMRDGVEVRLDNWMRRNDATSLVHSGDVVIVQRDSWVKRNAFSIVSGIGLVVSLLITATRR